MTPALFKEGSELFASNTGVDAGSDDGSST